jgi:hypothetical protein
MNARLMLCSCAILLFAGCDKSNADKFLMIENGFGYGGHSQGFPDRKTWAGLQYQDPTGKRTDVWAYLSMASPAVQITNNLAMLVGGVYDDGMKRFNDRLIVFEAPAGPPMDITDQVLRKYCAESDVAFTNVVNNSFTSITKTNSAVQIEFGILKRGERGLGTINIHDASMTISWHDIEAIMADVKRTGKLKKEKWSGVEYLQKE